MNVTQKLLNEIIVLAKEQGMSQRKLAQQAGITPEALSRAKKSGEISTTRLNALAETLHLELTLAPQKRREKSLEALKRGNLFADITGEHHGG